MLKVILVICIMLWGGSEAASCLASPDPVGTGKFCGYATSCKYGNFCDRAGVCQAVKAGGEGCLSDNECIYGTRCIGAVGSKTCVSYANPGDSCDDDVDTPTPLCGPALSCSNNTCTNGFVGDSCKSTSDCLGLLLCTNGICTNLPDEADCNSDNECHPNSFCDQNNVCSPRKMMGICNSPTDCLFGYGCLGVSSSDRDQCVEHHTRQVEEYCTIDEDCASKRCDTSTNRCAKKAVDVCTSDFQCSEGQACKCDGMTFHRGYGSCINNPCHSGYQKLAKCIDENCKITGTSFTSFSYPGSCVSTNCQKERETYLKCSPASKAVLSFFTLAFFTFFATFFGKKI